MLDQSGGNIRAWYTCQYLPSAGHDTAWLFALLFGVCQVRQCRETSCPLLA